jgi:hypothetical protein
MRACQNNSGLATHSINTLRTSIQVRVKASVLKLHMYPTIWTGYKINNLIHMIFTPVDVLAIVLSRFLTFLIDWPRFFFILEIRQESFLDLTARILPDFQEYKILDRTDKSCPASQDSVYMIPGWTDKISLFGPESCYILLFWTRIWKEWIEECRLVHSLVRSLF